MRSYARDADLCAALIQDDRARPSMSPGRSCSRRRDGPRGASLVARIGWPGLRAHPGETASRAPRPRMGPLLRRCGRRWFRAPGFCGACFPPSSRRNATVTKLLGHAPSTTTSASAAQSNSNPTQRRRQRADQSPALGERNVHAEPVLLPL